MISVSSASPSSEQVSEPSIRSWSYQFRYNMLVNVNLVNLLQVYYLCNCLKSTSVREPSWTFVFVLKWWKDTANCTIKAEKVFLNYKMEIPSLLIARKDDGTRLKRTFFANSEMAYFPYVRRKSYPSGPFTLTPESDQVQFSPSVSHQRYTIHYGELGVWSCSDAS